MKNVITLSFLLLFSLPSFGQADNDKKAFLYEYLVLDYEQNNFYYIPFEGIRFYNTPPDPLFGFRYVSELLNILGQRGYRLLNTVDLNPKASRSLIFERAIRFDSQILKEEIAKFKLDYDIKIEQIATERAKSATEQLRLNLIDAMKDAQLYEGKYKDAIIETALTKFRIELEEAIKKMK